MNRDQRTRHLITWAALAPLILIALLALTFTAARSNPTAPPPNPDLQTDPHTNQPAGAHTP
ncbi:MAG: hypothetical protein ACTS3F_04610 [Phycisphaerales bacterium]